MKAVCIGLLLCVTAIYADEHKDSVLKKIEAQLIQAQQQHQTDDTIALHAAKVTAECIDDVVHGDKAAGDTYLLAAITDCIEKHSDYPKDVASVLAEQLLRLNQ